LNLIGASVVTVGPVAPSRLAGKVNRCFGHFVHDADFFAGTGAQVGPWRCDKPPA